MKVIGAGLGRTGTNSLQAAIEQLGYGPCYHMFDVVGQPHRIRHWQAALAGDPDWDQVFRGYQSVVDFPAAVFWREITAHFPAAKVILTVRSPEAWYDSAASTIFRQAIRAQRMPLPGRVAFGTLRKLSPDFGAFTGMVSEAIVQRMFGGSVADRERAIEVFSQHNKEVTAAVPPDRLLVYDVAEGWGPLCAFLGVPVPDRPFPRANNQESFHRDEGRRMRRLIVRSLLRGAPTPEPAAGSRP
jgi:Sulfotransferase domain